MSSPNPNKNYMSELVKIISELIKELFKKTSNNANFNEDQIDGFKQGITSVRDEISLINKSNLDAKDYGSYFATEIQIATLDAVADIAKSGGDLKNLPTPQELTNRAISTISDRLKELGQDELFKNILHDYSKFDPAKINAISNSLNEKLQVQLGHLDMKQPLQYVSMACNKGLGIASDIINNQIPESPDQQRNPEKYNSIKREADLSNDFERKARSSNPELEI
jgi:hypothetical protein